MGGEVGDVDTVSPLPWCKVLQWVAQRLLTRVLPLPLAILFLAQVAGGISSAGGAPFLYGILILTIMSLSLVSAYPREFLPTKNTKNLAGCLQIVWCCLVIFQLFGTLAWAFLVVANAFEYMQYMPYRFEDAVDVPVCEPSRWAQASGGVYFDGATVNSGSPEIAFEVEVTKAFENCTYTSCSSSNPNWATCRCDRNAWVSRTYTVRPIFGQKNSNVPCAWSLGGEPGCLDDSSTAAFCGKVFVPPKSINFPDDFPEDSSNAENWATGGAASKEFEAAVEAFASRSELTYVKDLPQVVFKDPYSEVKEYQGVMGFQILLLACLILPAPALMLLCRTEVATESWQTSAPL